MCTAKISNKLCCFLSHKNKTNATNPGAIAAPTTKPYSLIGKTTNTFKLSHTNSHMGDAVAISLTDVGEGTAHTFTSQGIPSVGQSMPSPSNLAYGIE